MGQRQSSNVQSDPKQLNNAASLVQQGHQENFIETTDNSENKENDLTSEIQKLNIDAPPVKQVQPQSPIFDEENLPYAKGTILLRLSDGNQFNCVWKVDDRQLIRECLKEEETKANLNDSWYIVSNRCSGWLCDEAWRFMPLEVEQQIKSETEEKFRILWPSKAKIDEALETMKVEEAKLKEMKESQNAATKEALAKTMLTENSDVETSEDDEEDEEEESDDSLADASKKETKDDFVKID